MAHSTVLKVNSDTCSFTQGEYYHVGMKGIAATITTQPGWTIKTETITDESGFNKVYIYTVKDTVSEGTLFD